VTRPQSFGRRALPPTPEQRAARAAACWLYLLFALALTTALQIQSAGGVVLLVVLAFVSLLAGMAAAGEA
jgi:hypothetical protein